jgi:rod shape determining protein RodA
LLQKMRTRSSIFDDIDWVLVAIYSLMVLFGWLSIYAATFDEAHRGITDMTQNHGKQLLWIGLAAVIGIVLLLLDYRFFETFAYLIYGLGLFLLVAVLIFGSEIKGAQSWFVLGPVSFQPTEIAKYGTALAMAKFLSHQGQNFKQLRTKLMAIGFIITPVILILLQPDVGSTLVFFALLIVLYRQGLSKWIFIAGISMITLFILALYMKTIEVSPWNDLTISGAQIFAIALTAVVVLAIYLMRKIKGSWFVAGTTYAAVLVYFFSVDYLFDKVLQPHHQNRINELLGIVSDPQGAGYNVHQSKIAIGSGGFSGKGFLQGTQTKFHFVPEQSTDFIFCTVGEEWGFLGSLVVVSLFVILITRIIWRSETQRSEFTRIFGYCVASIFFIHFAINVGMAIGLAPVVGIPLPFFSYGGSSLWSFTILLFTYIKLDSEKKYVLR